MIITEREAIALIGLLKLNHRNTTILSKPKNIFQIELLSRVFNITKFPSEEVKRDLSIILSLSYKSIQIWFQNKRQRSKIEGKISARTERGEFISHNHLILIAIDVYLDIKNDAEYDMNDN